MSRKTKFIIPIILAVLIVFVSGCGYNKAEELNKQDMIIFAKDAIPVDTSDWLTYQNIDYRFDFRYPKDWVVNGSIDGGEFSDIPFYVKQEYSEICDMESSEKTCKTNGKILEINIQKLYTGYSSLQSGEEYSINNINGYLFIDNSPNKKNNVNPFLFNKTIRFGFIKDDNIIYIEMVYNSENSRFMFIEILKSLIMGIDTSCWLTYRNEEHKFQFKYPREWIIEEGSESDDYLLALISLETNENINKAKMIKSTFVPLGDIVVKTHDGKTLSDFLMQNKNDFDMVLNYEKNNNYSFDSYDVITGGYSKNYSLFINSGEIISFYFELAEEKDQISDIEKNILLSISIF